MGAIFGGRMPSPHTYLPGGFTATPTAERIAGFQTQLNWLLAFIRDVYFSDVETLARVYSDYRSIGAGPRNLLAYGVFDLDDTGLSKFLRTGYAEAGSARPVLSLDDRNITESVTHSWYNDSTNGLTPASGQTVPAYPKADAYSWLKAPRLAGKPFEVGALARMWVNGDYRDGISVIDRHAARARETLKVAQAMSDWLSQLQPGQPVYNGFRPLNGVGVGLTEAPRGALGHWVDIRQGKIAHYQVITPTCWNASPRDSQHVPGPLEQALVGTPVTDAVRPIEVLRVIHSFDPCLSCAVHILRPRGKPVVVLAHHEH